MGSGTAGALVTVLLVLPQYVTELVVLAHTAGYASTKALGEEPLATSCGL